MSNSNGVVSTEELIGKKSQKLSCVQLPSKAAFHSVAYFVGSAFSFMEHWAYQYSYIDMETFQNLNRNYFLFIHTLLSICRTNNQGLLYFRKLWGVLCFQQRYSGVYNKNNSMLCNACAVNWSFLSIMELLEFLQTIISKVWWHPMSIQKHLIIEHLIHWKHFTLHSVKIQGWLWHNFAFRSLEVSW